MVKYTLWGRDVNLDMAHSKFPSDAALKKMDDTLKGGVHGWFESPNDGKMLHYRQYLPDNHSPKAILVYSHGIHSHEGMGFVLKDGRKTNFALLSDRLLKAGMALYTPDMLGHGFSEGDRFFVPDWKLNRDDLDAFARFITVKHPDIPVFLGGDSYGACLAIHVARAWQDDPPANFKGFLVTAPAIDADMPPAPVTFVLRRILAPLSPRWTPFFMPHPVNPENIWRDEEVRELMESPSMLESPLNNAGQPFCLGTAVALVTALEQVKKTVIPSLKVPFLAQHGAEDHAVPSSGTDFLMETALSEDKEVIKVEGGYHDLMADPKGEEVVAKMIAWIEAHLV